MDKQAPVKTESVVEISELVKTYEHGDGVHGLNLQIKRGAAFGLLGPNGAGKSTTIKVLMGLLAPTSGEVSFFGESVQGDLNSPNGVTHYSPGRSKFTPQARTSKTLGYTIC
tara:strand:- start:2126 stop:2461 length:336 start_codon:yes stop_codon:yes gene_type:complete